MSSASNVAAYSATGKSAGLDRTKLRKILMIGGVAIVLAIAATVYLISGRYVGSDDSYVRANKLMVATDVSGLVQTVNVHQGQPVKKGDVLFTLDPKPFEIAVENAKAALGQTVQDVESTRAMYRAAVGQIAAQKAQLVANQQTYDRYLALAKQNAATQLAKLNGNPNEPAEKTPEYQKAKANVDEAQRQLDHAVVRAPFDGTVSEVDSLQPGTLVVSALSAFTTTSAVGLIGKDVWVESDMKETDLTHVRLGAPVGITVDTYPGCKWNGHIDSVNAGSDSSFSALPAENASGNWVKVVQRIPVRIAIDHGSCASSLRAGMSAVTSIDTGKRRITRLRDEFGI